MSSRQDKKRIWHVCELHRQSLGKCCYPYYDRYRRRKFSALNEQTHVQSDASMKNVQLIDGADNTAYNIYAVSDEDFELIFPNGQDIEFIEDFFKRVGSKRAKQVQESLSRGLQRKTEVNGIHGTLFYQLKRQKKRYYPNKKFSDDPSSTR
ncbi:MULTISPECIES: hypothetical protein [unclassified Mesorhizobium]|nr:MULTISPECIES: hypothetical protein [unclassified Mesorhizobium]